MAMFSIDRFVDGALWRVQRDRLRSTGAEVVTASSTLLSARSFFPHYDEGETSRLCLSVALEANPSHHGRKVADFAIDRPVNCYRTRVGQLLSNLLGNPRLKVLFITGFAENAAVANGHLDAGMSIITRPFSNAALVNKVREIIDG